MLTSYPQVPAFGWRGNAVTSPTKRATKATAKILILIPLVCNLKITFLELNGPSSLRFIKLLGLGADGFFDETINLSN